MDFASEEQRMELFCLKLPSPASEYLDLVGLAVCRCSHPLCFRLQGGIWQLCWCSGAQEFKKLFEESMQKNAKFVASTESEETAEDIHANGSAVEEDKSQDKATSELADSMKSKAKVEDA